MPATTCLSCKQPIVFLYTRRGERMPVNADTVGPQDVLYAPKRGHVPHWAVCPASTGWKGKSRHGHQS